MDLGNTGRLGSMRIVMVKGERGGLESTYNDLDNKPSINGITLVGDQTAASLSLNDASALTTGTLPVGRVPSLNANKITTGTLNPARLPLATTSTVGGVTVDGTTIVVNNSGEISSNAGVQIEQFQDSVDRVTPALLWEGDSSTHGTLLDGQLFTDYGYIKIFYHTSGTNNTFTVDALVPTDGSVGNTVLLVYGVTQNLYFSATDFSFIGDTWAMDSTIQGVTSRGIRGTLTNGRAPTITTVQDVSVKAIYGFKFTP